MSKAQLDDEVTDREIAVLEAHVPSPGFELITESLRRYARRIKRLERERVAQANGLEAALRNLVRFLVMHPELPYMKLGNPACWPEVTTAMQVLADLDGHSDPLTLDLNKSL